MLGPELLSKMRAVVAAKKAVSAAAEMVHATADARIREAVSTSLFCLFCTVHIIISHLMAFSVTDNGNFLSFSY